VQQVTSSIVYSSGSNIFGNSLSNTQQFTGSVSVTGSLTVNGALSGTSAVFSGNVRLNAPVTGKNKLIFGIVGTDYYWLEYDDATGDIAYASKYKHIFYGGASGTSQILSLANNGAATFASTVAINGSTSVDSLTVSRNADNNSGGLTLFNANTSGYGSALTFRINYAGVYNTSRIHGDWDTGNSGNLYFYTANTSQSLVERMRINGLGNVGIGTTSPDVTGFGWRTLTIKGGNNSGDAGVLELQSPATTGAANLGIIVFLDGSNRNAQISVQRASSTTTGNMLFYTNAGAGIVERMAITSGGAVSINSGITNYHQLSIKSNGVLTYQGLGVYSSSNDRFISMNHTGTEGFIETENAGSGVMTPLSFKTGGSPRMTITSGGNVGIGETNPGSKLHVAGNTYTEGIYVATGQITQGASATNTFYTFSEISSNRVFLITLRQSGSGANNVVAIGFTFGASLGAYNIIQDNTNPVLFLTISASGLGLRLTTGSGYGSTTWDWTITQIK
jgi:hypothetical protein